MMHKALCIMVHHDSTNHILMWPMSDSSRHFQAFIRGSLPWWMWGGNKTWGSPLFGSKWMVFGMDHATTMDDFGDNLKLGHLSSFGTVTWGCLMWGTGIIPVAANFSHQIDRLAIKKVNHQPFCW